MFLIRIRTVIYFCILTAALPYTQLTAQTVETVDGVRIVHNNKPLQGNNPKISLEYVRTIGVVEGDENQQFYGPFDVAIADDGTHYILDSGNFRIQVFDRDLNYICSIGKKGQGPGEFNLQPLELYLSNVKELFLNIFCEVYFQRLSLSGKEVNRGIFEFNSRNSGILSSGEVVRARMNQPYRLRDGEPDFDDALNTRVIGVYNEDCELLYEFADALITGDGKVDRQVNICHLTVKDDYIYCNYNVQNRIEKYSRDGTLLMKIDRKLPYPIEYKMKKDERTLAGNINALRYLPEFTFVSGEIEVDDRGRIWVNTLLSQDESDKNRSVIEVYAPDGILLCRLPLPEKRASNWRIFGDRFFYCGRETMFVDEYRIVELN